MGRRVVVTGIGVVSPVGTGRQRFRDSLRQGKCGIGGITRFDSNGFPVKKAAEVKDFPVRREWDGLDRFVQFTLFAAEEACGDAGLAPEELRSPRTGITVSSSKGGLETLEKFHREFLAHGVRSTAGTVSLWENFLPGAAASRVARTFGIGGPAYCTVTACATGTHSIISGYYLIREGHADIVFAGAGEAALTPLLLSGYFRMGVLARECMRPFDKERDGFIPGEGAAVLVLEEKGHAERRHARVYGEILGVFRGEEPGHITDLAPEGEVLCEGLKRLADTVRSSGGGIDYINTHGTATRSGDLYEIRNIKKAFGKEAYRLSLSSTKSMTGHLLGSAGAVEAVACLCAMEHEFIPPTINLQKPDPECDLDCTPNAAVRKKVRTALSVSIGFGGHIGVVMFGKLRSPLHPESPAF